jgi:hypothetical protein
MFELADRLNRLQKLIDKPELHAIDKDDLSGGGEKDV